MDKYYLCWKYSRCLAWEINTFAFYIKIPVKLQQANPEASVGFDHTVEQIMEKLINKINNKLVEVAQRETKWVLQNRGFLANIHFWSYPLKEILSTNPVSDLVNPGCFNFHFSGNENLKID